MSKPYDILATYYDYLQREVDYTTWQKLVSSYIKKDSKILEIGCGTGKLANLLNLKQYDYKGYDYSSAMISQAKTLYPEYNFFTADAYNYLDEAKYDMIICFMDTINYLTDLNKLKTTFENISNNLSDSGVFIFDIHMEDNIYNFDGYLESGFIDGDEYRWYSHIIDERNNIVAHDFEFNVANEKYFECHHQNISPKNVYEDLFNNYFTILDHFEDDYRYYYVLTKRRF